jgi:putative transcriptional regulator
MDNRIKVLRAEQYCSLQTLAHRIGGSRQVVNAVERAKHEPSLQLAFDIAEYFDQRIEDIFFPEKKSDPEDCK